MAEADPRLDTADPAIVAVAPAPRRRWLRPALMLAVPAIVLAVAAYVWLTSGGSVSTDNAYVQQDVVSVSPDVSGRIVDVRVGENRRVRRGDILFVIDPEPYRVALEQADAAVAEARVDLATKATDSEGAAAGIESARADVVLAQATYDRQTALMRRGFTTRASLDAARHSLAAANATLATAGAAAARARAQLESGTAAGGSPAAVQVALAKRHQAALNLQRTVVRAPIDGIVSQTSRLQIGNITPSGVPALSLVATGAAWITANFKETDLKRMRIGDCATLSVDAYPDMHVRGHVESIGAGTGSEFSILPAQNANANWVKVTQRVPVRIAIDGGLDRPLIAGLSIDAHVDLNRRCG